MKNPSPTGMALMQDGTLNLTFVANALRFYANHIEGHPQRGDYFPADLRLAADMLASDTPPPSSHVGVEDEIARMVQSVNEWDDRTSPDDYPEHLLITSEELRDLLRNFAASSGLT